MKLNSCLFMAVALLPLPALALPAIGDLVGQNPTDVKAVLAAAGCPVDKFEVEGAKIEAKCRDSAGTRWEVYINPNTGKVLKIKKDH